MAAQKISRHDLAFGRAVLLATDGLDMSAEGAFWIWSEDSPVWRYFLITSLFSTMGPREIYLRLNKALSVKLSERETREFDLFIASPHDAFVRRFPRSARTAPHASEPIDIAFKSGNKQIRATIYRFAPEMSNAEVARTQRKFKRTVRELLAA